MNADRAPELNLNLKRKIWVRREHLGAEKVIRHNHKHYGVKIPVDINQQIVLRLKGLGRTRGGRTGDLLLHVRLNQGIDVSRNLWLSETCARDGASKAVGFELERIRVSIPRNSRDGSVVRVGGLGRRREFSWHTAFLPRPRGDLLVKLRVFPDRVTPRYGSFAVLNTDDMALEGWVYAKTDEIWGKLGKSRFLAPPLEAESVADQFNTRGWRGVFDALLRHLQLKHLDISLTTSGSMSLPGACQKTVVARPNHDVVRRYALRLNERFLDNPFAIAAIVAHELCHVIYSEVLDSHRDASGYLEAKQQSLEEERTVDLLAFMFGIGEFQLRVARDMRLTLGYFDQVLFERIQVIVARKLGWA